jgi:TRAP-type C4-dicarboxylate transport system, small permease component
MSLAARLGRGLDAVSGALFALAGAALVAACGLYVFEVAARYLFDAPTTWSGEAVRYCLAALIFLALPEVTRRGAHVSIDILPGLLPPRGAEALERAAALLGALACGAAAWIAAGEAGKQLSRGLMTNAAHPIPRWWITAVIATGLLGAALHFLRRAAGPRP